MLHFTNEPEKHILRHRSVQFISTCPICSPSLIPADNEWSFVVNFDGGLAIRFSCNSRAAMNEWVECIRHKLGEMGILNPKGNLYSKVRILCPLQGVPSGCSLG